MGQLLNPAPLDAAPNTPALLEIRGLKKWFSGARALDGVDLVVQAGSVHGLLGENGAGKSTLIKTLSGLIVPDAGRFLIDGVEQPITSVRQSEALGFRFIHQELSLVPHFSAIENCFVGRPYPRKGPFIHRAAMAGKVAQAAHLIAPELPLDVPASRLTTGQKQLAEIIRALLDEDPAHTVRSQARVVVMDEPTASLSDGEAQRLHRAVRVLAGQGVAIIFISHRLDEVLDICDRYTVLRNGTVSGTGAIAGASREQLISLMSGKNTAAAGRASPIEAGKSATGKRVLDVMDVPYGESTGENAQENAGSRSGPSQNTLSFSVREGEILGLYGLIGAGRSSLLKQIWGARRHAGGRIVIDGQDMGRANITQRIRAGGAFVPEDRRGEGLITPRSIADNLALTDLTAVRMVPKLPLTSTRRLAQRATNIRGRLAVKMASVHAKPLTLSGGNQQKLLFGRWFGRPLRLLLLDEPSRGVDVGAKAEIHALVRQMAEQGAAVLMATSDMDELLALSSRVLVMAGGRITAELVGKDIEPRRIVAAAFSLSAQRNTPHEERDL